MSIKIFLGKCNGTGLSYIVAGNSIPEAGQEFWAAPVQINNTSKIVAIELAVERLKQKMCRDVSGWELSLVGYFDAQAHQVDVLEHGLFLITTPAGACYWLSNDGRFKTVDQLENFISNLGLGEMTWSCIEPGNYYSVIKAYTSIEKVAPQVVVILDDGNPVQVQVGGCPKHLNVSVFNIVHSDDRGDINEGCIGALSHASGKVDDFVMVVTPEIVRLDCAADVARFV